MTDEFLEEEEEPEERTVTVKRSQIRELEQSAKAGRKALEKLAEFERRDAFVQAGIPMSDKRAAYFQKGYEGELTPEAIKAEWEESFGQSQEPQTDPAEAAAHQRVAEASTGAEPPRTAFTLEDLNNAQSPEEVMQMAGAAGLLATRE